MHSPTLTPNKKMVRLGCNGKAALARAVAIVVVMWWISTDPAAAQSMQDDVGARIVSGQRLIKAGQPADAIAELDAAVQADPTNRSARFLLAVASAATLRRFEARGETPVPPEQLRSVQALLDAQLRYALEFTAPWPMASYRVDLSNPGLEGLNSPDHPTRILSLVRPQSDPELIARLTQRALRETRGGYEVHLALVAALQDQQSLTEVAKRGYAPVRRAAAAKVDDEPRLADIVLANLQDARESDLYVVFASVERLAQPAVLARLERDLLKSPWRGPAATMAAIMRVKREFLQQLAPKYSGARVRTLLSSTNQSYGLGGTTVRSVVIRIDVLAAGAEVAGRPGVLTKDFAPRFPPQVSVGTTWWDPEPRIEPATLLAEFKKFLGAQSDTAR